MLKNGKKTAKKLAKIGQILRRKLCKICKWTNKLGIKLKKKNCAKKLVEKVGKNWAKNWQKIGNFFWQFI